MKNTKSVEPDAGAEGGMQDEHSYDYNKAKPNCFEGKIGQNQLMVCLDAAFAAVFKATESVNHVLWAIITSFPTTEKKAIDCCALFRTTSPFFRHLGWQHFHDQEMSH